MFNSASDNYVPLTENRVVRELIRSRSRLDSAYVMRLYETKNPVESNGVPPFNEDILCVYIDLDRAIERCGLSPAQQTVICELMKGYGIADIAENCFTEKVNTRTAFVHFVRGVDKICRYAYDENTRALRKRMGIDSKDGRNGC